MKNTYHEVIHAFPFNSFGKIFLAEGKEYPEQFGGNCVFLTRQLTRRLIQSGLSPHCIEATNRVHWAVLCREGKEIYHLDPFLMHQEPIPVSSVLRSEKTATYDALPIVSDHPTKLQITPRGKHTFSIATFGFRAGTYRPIRAYDYDLRQTLSEAPSDWERARDNNESTYLTLRTVDQSGIATKICLHGEGFMSAHVLGKEKYRQASDARFHETFERVAQQLRTDIGRLMSFFYDGQKLYQERDRRMHSSNSSTHPRASHR